MERRRASECYGSRRRARARPTSPEGHPLDASVVSWGLQGPGCGKKGPPLVPYVRIQAIGAVETPASSGRVLTFAVPAQNSTLQAGGRRRIEVYASTPRSRGRRPLLEGLSRGAAESAQGARTLICSHPAGRRSAAACQALTLRATSCRCRSVGGRRIRSSPMARDGRQPVTVTTQLAPASPAADVRRGGVSRVDAPDGQPPWSCSGAPPMRTHGGGTNSTA